MSLGLERVIVPFFYIMPTVTHSLLRVCRICASSTSYVSIPKDDVPLRTRLEELAAERRRFGYRRLAVLLRRIIRRFARTYR
jgi:hypothetical protein